MNKFYGVVLLVGLSVANVRAVTLEQALVNTYNTNTEFKAQQESAMADNEKVVQALAGWRPNLEISTTMGLNKQINSGDAKNYPGSNIPSNTAHNTKDAGINLKQNLYAGGSTVAQIKQAENTIRASWAALHSVEQTVLFNAVQAYLELISKFTQLELYKANKAAHAKNLEDARAKREVGEETRTQEANALSRYAEADARLQQAGAELEGAKATYERVIGLPAPYSMAKPIVFKDLPKTLDEAIAIAELENPDIVSAEFEYVSAQADADRIFGGLLPTVDVVGSSTRRSDNSKSTYDYKGAPPTNTTDYTTDNRVVIQARFNLYDGGAGRSQRRQALSLASQKRINIATKKRKVQESVIQNWRNYIAAKNNIKNYQNRVEAAQIALDGTTQELNVGTKVLLDVLNAQAELLQAQLNLIDATKTYCLESYRLLMIIGRLTAKHLKLEVDYFDPQSHYNQIRRYL